MSTAKKRKSFDNFAGWTDEKIDDWIKERKRLERKSVRLHEKLNEIRMTHAKRLEDTTKVRYLYLKEHKLDVAHSFLCDMCRQTYSSIGGNGRLACPWCDPTSSCTIIHYGKWGAHDANVPGEGAFLNVPVRGSTEDCLACILSR
jgi:hypothetical protein